MFQMKPLRMVLPGLIGMILLLLVPHIAEGDVLGETPEIQFSSDLAQELKVKADELANPVAIYEYVRNNFEYEVHHGSYNNSINTFLRLRGNDVELASTLIALLRSQNIPSRYVVGNIKISSSDLMNWLNVKNLELAVGILRDQGIQGPATNGPELSLDGSTVTFEHVWVEAFVSYHNYRGVGLDSGTECSVQNPPSSCKWVPLGPSFKLKSYHNQNIDIYDQVIFDYDKLYNAIRNDDSFYKDRNPLDIYKSLVIDYLRINYPGKTLEDVMDPGIIIRDESGLLPASLPFEVVGNIRRYDSILEHDQGGITSNPAGPKRWQKFLRMTMLYDVGNTEVSADAGTVLLSDTTVQRLTMSFRKETTSSVVGTLTTRLGEVVVATPYTYQNPDGSDFNLETIAFPFRMKFDWDSAPAVEAGQNDDVVTAEGVNYLLGAHLIIYQSGTYTSNWSQVYRAVDQLLAANETYPILNDPQGVPYVDENSNGLIDPNELELLEHSDALGALTGGLLYVAATQYFANLSDAARQLGALNHVTSQRENISIFGSIDYVEYLDNTVFSVSPGGLLVDIMCCSGSSWRINSPENLAISHNKLYGHILSSGEHEIWQDVTGLDAISAIRGIQKTLVQDLNDDQTFDASLLKFKKTSPSYILPYSDFGFSSAPTSPIVQHDWNQNDWNIFSTQPTSWRLIPDDANDPGFYFMKTSVTNSDRDLDKHGYWFYKSNFVDEYFSVLNGLITYLLGLNQFLDTSLFWQGVYYSGTPPEILDDMEATYMVDWEDGLPFNNVIDRAQGFVASEQKYRSLDGPVDQILTGVVFTIRNGLDLNPVDTVEVITPSRSLIEDNYKFGASIQLGEDTGGYKVFVGGLVAGGGYVSFPKDVEP